MVKKIATSTAKKQKFDLGKFNFELDQYRTKTMAFYDVRLVSIKKKPEGAQHTQYNKNIYFGKFFRENKLAYKKVSIGVNGKGKDTEIIMVFDNNYFNNDNLEIKNPDESPRVGTAKVAVNKILSALEISEKEQAKGVEIIWDVELVDAKNKVYLLKQTALNILDKKG